jgi:hypothetical protein
MIFLFVTMSNLSQNNYVYEEFCYDVFDLRQKKLFVTKFFKKMS